MSSSKKLKRQATPTAGRLSHTFKNQKYLDGEVLSACKNGDLQRLQHTIESGGRFGTLDPSLNNPLHLAILGVKAGSPNINIVSFLLNESESSFDSENADGLNPLMLAIKLQSAYISNLLLEKQYSLSSNLPDGTPVLVAAARCPGPHGVRLAEALLRREEALSAPGPGWGRGHSGDLHEGPGALWEAVSARAEEDDPQLVALLLEHGADPDARGPGGATPLHVSVAAGAGAIVAALLSAGADANARDAGGFTPLHRAAAAAAAGRGGEGRAGALAALLAAGVDVHARGWNGHTPLHVAAWEGRPEALEALLAAGADIDAETSFGLTALHVAVLTDQMGAVRLLLERGADADRTAFGLGGQGALHLAALKGMDDAVEGLVRAGANEAVADDLRMTPYGLARAEGHAHVVQALERLYGRPALEAAEAAAHSVEAAPPGRRFADALDLACRKGGAGGDAASSSPGGGGAAAGTAAAARLRFLPIGVVLRERRFPLNQEAETKEWLVPAYDLSEDTPVLYLNLGEEGEEDAAGGDGAAAGSSVDLLAHFLGSDAGHGVEYLWVAKSCTSGSSTSGRRGREAPMALLRASAVLLLPEVIVEDAEGALAALEAASVASSPRVSTPDKRRESGGRGGRLSSGGSNASAALAEAALPLAVTDVAGFLRRPRCYLGAAAATAAGKDVFLAYQWGTNYGSDQLPMYGGTTSGLGIAEAAQAAMKKVVAAAGASLRPAEAHRLAAAWGAPAVAEPAALLPLAAGAAQSVRGGGLAGGFLASDFNKEHPLYNDPFLAEMRECILALDSAADTDALIGPALMVFEHTQEIERATHGGRRLSDNPDDVEPLLQPQEGEEDVEQKEGEQEEGEGWGKEWREGEEEGFQQKEAAEEAQLLVPEPETLEETKNRFFPNHKRKDDTRANDEPEDTDEEYQYPPTPKQHEHPEEQAEERGGGGGDSEEEGGGALGGGGGGGELRFAARLERERSHKGPRRHRGKQRHGAVPAETPRRKPEVAEADAKAAAAQAQAEADAKAQAEADAKAASAQAQAEVDAEAQAEEKAKVQAEADAKSAKNIKGAQRAAKKEAVNVIEPDEEHNLNNDFGAQAPHYHDRDQDIMGSLVFDPNREENERLAEEARKREEEEKRVKEKEDREESKRQEEKEKKRVEEDNKAKERQHRHQPSGEQTIEENKDNKAQAGGKNEAREVSEQEAEEDRAAGQAYKSGCMSCMVIGDGAGCVVS